ncbi:MelG protein (non-ribosomal peptide synthetase)-like protein [Ramlibacter tataouinensis TTB310]|uniref:MelG protein (Non-ribosomal peptide synthetase)-like protein n=1 Tax=Ramlibacter tataouinensis (strain ATCC BAA-407 / DSM 14655 / LMG 21543 / TTB310) TaxID=365046 RepID=F5XW49_RAMTT|nr:MupA/Atu3671 family FMN-dependent luciferase-like monooxygenase [Ramlibacter tataouinensis]AEG94152.1 MelG protein (non-ribosomal peptide synthetase)-like protein [Ramlibacter tataouinensis TTB310]
MSSTAVFVGDGSLLVQCAEAFRSAGHRIVAVLTDDAGIRQWADGLGLPTLSSQAGGDLPEGEFDYLFSVANLRVLPPSLLARARKLALNFHDGPLPRYAGLNATAWALMAGEKEHGITWHEMTAAVDAGRIARQSLFTVAPQDTSLSLNARCYEAGLAAFQDIVADIGRGGVPLAPQSGERSWFGRHRRPEALATLDLERAAEQLAALVRGLDFGHSPNPLARPKLYLGDRLVLVRTAQVVAPVSTAPAGVVLGVDGDGLRVATGRGELLLGGCLDPAGGAALRDVRVGMRLPTLPATVRKLLSACAERIARAEAFWTPALAAPAAPQLPYPRLAAASAAVPPAVPLQLALPAAVALAGFAAWLSALTGQERVSLWYGDEILRRQAEPLGLWLAAGGPLDVATPAAAQVPGQVAQAEAMIAKAREAGPATRDLPLRLGGADPAAHPCAKYGLCLNGMPAPAGLELVLQADDQGLWLRADAAVFAPETARLMAGHLAAYLRAFSQATGPLAQVSLVPQAEAAQLARLNATMVSFDAQGGVPAAIGAWSRAHPEAEALRHHDSRLSHHELQARSDALARVLRQRGVRPGDVVGLCLPRTPELVLAVLAIHKAGAAYLPLDPEYPRDRLSFMAEDSGAPLIVCSRHTRGVLDIDAAKAFILEEAPADQGTGEPLPGAQADAAAYVIYTSGSTGRPKGVVVTHRNVMNFFAGMDERVPHEPGGRWLAVTSLSFDISVLELLWTLSRGFTVVLHSRHAPAAPAEAGGQGPEFSLFYFASEESAGGADRYRLLMEGAQFADREGFAAVWTPERHFHAFGGLYPNPAVASAAIAAVTRRVQIRAGSCVLPLHHPVRVAEDWALVDNLSQGRVGISFAAGWQPNDFVLAPQAFADRKERMLAHIETVRRLWRGETLAFPGPQGKDVSIRTLPRPVQRELPVWLTAAGNPETFEQAGARGCHLLTHLLGQSIEDVAQKITLYRAAWRKAGHPGNGQVTIMMHTFVGPDEEAVLAVAREPMKSYLRSSVDLIRQAAWSFPTFVQRGAANGKSPLEVMESEPLSAQDMDALLDHAFSRYWKTSSLIGAPERCLAMVDRLREAGVDEIACLIDFGIPNETVLEHLHDLKRLMDASRQRRQPAAPVSVAGDLLRHEVTHLQCTPSMATMLTADAQGREALSRLSALLVGGEALPLKLARELRALLPGRFVNMYGPTETTVWSTTCDLDQLGDFVPLGQPIANTQLSIRTARGQECPALVPGELLIGGEGVTRGYLGRPELNAERFTPDAAQPGSRFYRTGDLVRRHPDGRIEFLGRIDHQVKIRGHRIELGEIENALMRQPGVQQAVVLARQDSVGESFLLGYVVPKAGATPEAEALRRNLAQELPEIMVPKAVLVMAAFPLTPNGKVDRNALAQSKPVAAAKPPAPPSSQLEQTISAIWAEVLGLSEVGTQDNFFDLGGHSLLVVQVQRRLREATGQEVSITDMFRLPTVAAIAAHLAGRGNATAVSDGLSRAQARRAMRSRSGAQQTPVS